YRTDECEEVGGLYTQPVVDVVAVRALQTLDRVRVLEALLTLLERFDTALERRDAGIVAPGRGGDVSVGCDSVPAADQSGDEGGDDDTAEMMLHATSLPLCCAEPRRAKNSAIERTRGRRPGRGTESEEKGAGALRKAPAPQLERPRASRSQTSAGSCSSGTHQPCTCPGARIGSLTTATGPSSRCSASRITRSARPFSLLRVARPIR